MPFPLKQLHCARQPATEAGEWSRSLEFDSTPIRCRDRPIPGGLPPAGGKPSGPAETTASPRQMRPAFSSGAVVSDLIKNVREPPRPRVEFNQRKRTVAPPDPSDYVTAKTSNSGCDPGILAADQRFEDKAAPGGEVGSSSDDLATWREWPRASLQRCHQSASIVDRPRISDGADGGLC